MEAQTFECQTAARSPSARHELQKGGHVLDEFDRRTGRYEKQRGPLLVATPFLLNAA